MNLLGHYRELDHVKEAFFACKLNIDQAIEELEELDYSYPKAKDIVENWVDMMEHGERL